MEGFNVVDGVILAIVLLSAVLAFARGLVREIMAILGWIAAAFVAFIFAPQVKPLIKETPLIGPIISLDTLERFSPSNHKFLLSSTFTNFFKILP